MTEGLAKLKELQADCTNADLRNLACNDILALGQRYYDGDAEAGHALEYIATWMMGIVDTVHKQEADKS